MGLFLCRVKWMKYEMHLSGNLWEGLTNEKIESTEGTTSRVRKTCQWERQHHPPCVLGTE